MPHYSPPELFRIFLDQLWREEECTMHYLEEMQIKTAFMIAARAGVFKQEKYSNGGGTGTLLKLAKVKETGGKASGWGDGVCS